MSRHFSNKWWVWLMYVVMLILLTQIALKIRRLSIFNEMRGGYYGRINRTQEISAHWKKLRDLKQKGQFPKTELAEPTLELVVFTIIIIFTLYYLFEYSGEWLSAVLYADIDVGLATGVDVLWWCIGGLALLKLVMAIFEWVMINKAVISTEALGWKWIK